MAALIKKQKKGSIGDMISGLASVQMTTQSQLDSMILSQKSSLSCINELGRQFVNLQRSTDAKVDNVDTKVEKVDGKVSHVTKEVSYVTKEVAKLTRENQKTRRDLFKKSGSNPLFLPVLHQLFNGKTGVYGWFPVGYTDAQGVLHKVVVISMHVLIWYYERERPDVKIPDLKIRSYSVRTTPSRSTRSSNRMPTSSTS